MASINLTNIVSTLAITGSTVNTTNTNANAALKNTLTTSASGTTVLTVNSTTNQTLIGTLTQTYQLPDATSMGAIGNQFNFYNKSSMTLSIVDNASDVITSLLSGQSVSIIVTNILTSSGIWQVGVLNGAPSNLAGGAVNEILYQTANSTTGFISATNNSVLVTSNTGVPSLSTTLPDFTIKGNLSTFADNTYNIGNSTNAFADIYTYNVISNVGLNLNSTGTNTISVDSLGSGTANLGYTNATTINIGNSNSTINVTSSSGNINTIGNIVPITNNINNIGTSSKAYSELYTYAVDGVTGGTLILGGTNSSTTTLGNSTGSNTTNIKAGLGNINTTGNIVPIANNTYNIGSSSLAFGNLYGYNIDSATSIGLNVGNTNATSVTIGNATNATSVSILSNSGGTINLNPTVTGSVIITGNTYPVSDNTYTMGTNTDAFSKLYSYNVTSSGALSLNSTGTAIISVDSLGAGTANIGITNATTINIGNTSAIVNIKSGSSNINTTGNIVPSVTNTNSLGTATLTYSELFTPKVDSGTSGTLGIGTTNSTTTTIGNTSGTNSVIIQAGSGNIVTTGNVVPNATASYTLGLASKTYLALFTTIVDAGSVGSLSIGNTNTSTLSVGTNTATTTLNIGNASTAITINGGSTTSGTVTINTGTLAVVGSGTNGSITATGNITAFNTSDSRLKENIHPIENALNKVKQIRGVTYDWTDDYIQSQGGEDGYFIRKHDVGVIAQDIQKVLPEVVAEKSDGHLGVKYDKIVALLIEAIKDLSNKIDILEGK